MDVSVAFQGGGAKVIELMAAAVACKRAQEAGTFAVKRVSGVSAGAVAAAMFATQCDIEKVIANAYTLESHVKEKFPASRLTKTKVLWQLIRGKPIFDEADVRELIVKLFEIGDVDAEAPIRDLVKNGVELRIVYSDVRFNVMRILEERADTRLADALTDSTAIPFAFRFPGSSGNPEKLDGGLFQNLPARAALEGLKDNHTPLGFSFEKDEAPDLRKADIFEYGKAILNSLISERVGSSASQLKPSNVINIPKRRTTFEFAKIFSDRLVADFSQDVSEINTKIVSWVHSLRGINGFDWHSDHPIDLAMQTSIIQNEVNRFYEEILPGYEADSIKHEITYQSFNLEMPDIYETSMTLSGDRNPGFQFMRFAFYDSDEGPLATIKVQIFDKNGEARKAMFLPFKMPGRARTRATLVCLGKPLQKGETITIRKTEESFLSLKDYQGAEAFTLETLGIGVGRSSDNVEIVTHFPQNHFPKHYDNASRDREKDAAKLKDEKGEQLKAVISVANDLRAGCRSVVCKTKAPGLTQHRRYASVSFYR